MKVKTLAIERFILSTLVVGLPVMAAQAHPPNAINELDRDADGSVSQQELQIATAEKVKQLDSNSDGFISINELKSGYETRLAKRREKRMQLKLARADSDGDGLVSVNEFKQARVDRIMRRDKDGNGRIDDHEFAEPSHVRSGPHKRCD